MMSWPGPQPFMRIGSSLKVGYLPNILTSGTAQLAADFLKALRFRFVAQGNSSHSLMLVPSSAPWIRFYGKFACEWPFRLRPTCSRSPRSPVGYPATIR